MKRVAVVAAFFVLLAIGYVFWPYDKLVQGLDANGRVENDLELGYPAALNRTGELEAFVRRQHPELRRAAYSWQEVRCGIDDLVTQFPTGDFRQECTLRSVWLVPDPNSSWGGCAVPEYEFGSTEAEADGDATAALVRAWTADLQQARDPELPSQCPVLGQESREYSRFIYGADRSRLVSGRRPGDLTTSPSWLILEVEVFLSSTEIGCRPAFLFCASRFDRPSMDGVDKLAGSAAG